MNAAQNYIILFWNEHLHNCKTKFYRVYGLERSDCQSVLRISASWSQNKPLKHYGTMISKGLRGTHKWDPIMPRYASLVEKNKNKLHTEKTFLGHVKFNKIWILITLFHSIFAPNRSPSGAKSIQKILITIQICLNLTWAIKYFCVCG